VPAVRTMRGGSRHSSAVDRMFSVNAPTVDCNLTPRAAVFFAALQKYLVIYTSQI